MTPFEQLVELLTPRQREAVEVLSTAFGADDPTELPPLTRVTEDLAAVRRYGELRDRGESHTHAIRRTAGDLGMPPGTMRKRIDSVLKRTGQR